jgi:hypothetical protein
MRHSPQLLPGCSKPVAHSSREQHHGELEVKHIPDNLLPSSAPHAAPARPSSDPPTTHTYTHRTFSWRNLAIGYVVYAIPGIFGITLCYHRMLTHRSFKTYK